MKNIEENNLKIAKYMDVEIGNPKSLIDSWMGKTSYFKYHFEWEYLMPVVEKITKLLNDHEKVRKDTPVFGFDKGNARFNMPNGFIMTGDGKTLIESTYDVVVKFIKWYNEQK